MQSIAWLAGLLEGEGCFTQTRSGSSGIYTTPLVTVVMTDSDVIQEAHILFEQIGEHRTRIGERSLPSGKIAYSLYITGLPAMKIMYSVLPFMGKRRSAAIRSVLARWNPVKYKEAVAFKHSLQGVA